MRKLELRLGLCDDPVNQCRPEYTADLCSTHLAVYGEHGKGKATFLTQAVLQIHAACRDCPEEIYLLSFGNRLAALKPLPLVAACLDGADPENVRRIFRLLAEKLARSRRLLGGVRFAQAEQPPVPHLTFVIEGADRLFAESGPRCELFQQELTRFAREGLGCGLSLILSADAPCSGLVRLMGHNFRRVVSYTLTKPDDYGSLFPGRVREPLPLPGRGLALQEGRTTYEFQGYLPWLPGGRQETFLQQLTQALTARVRHPAPKLRVLSGELTPQTWPLFCSQPSFLPGTFTAGLDYERTEPLRLDLTTAGAVLITGKRGGGRSNLLRGILAGALEIPDCRFVFYEDGRGRLQDVMHLFEGRQAPTVVRGFDALMEQVCGPCAPPAPPAAVRFADFADLLTGEVPPQPPLPEPQPADPGMAAPFTVFVIQSSRFYLSAEQAERLSPWFQTAAEHGQLFVFSEAKSHGPAASCLFGGQVPYMVVLDSIVSFCQNSRVGRFADMDLRELKEEYGPGGDFVPGEGYWFDTEADELIKFKALHCEAK